MAGAEVALVDDAHSVRLQLLDVRVQPIDVDGKVVKTFAAAFDEPSDEAGPARGFLDEFHLVPVHVEAGDEKGPVPAGVRRAAQSKREVALEEPQRRLDVTHGNGNVVDAHAHGAAVAQREFGDGRPFAVGGVVRLPELDEDAVGAARGDEARHIAVGVFETVDDADPVRLHAVQQGRQARRSERPVVQPRAAFVQKSLHETVVPGRLDQFDLELADVEVTPHEVARVARPGLDVHFDREMALEERQSVGDARHRDRHVIHPHRFLRNGMWHSNASATSFG